MGLSENILKTLGLIESSVPCSYRVTLCGGMGVYIEGAEKIIDVNKEKIIFLVKGGKIIIEGSNLRLKSFVGKDSAVTGEILKVLKE